MTTNAYALGNVQTNKKTAIASPLFYARLAGFLYLVITVAAIIAHMYVPTELIVPDDAAATVSNITANESLFRVGIASEMVVLLSEIILSVLLYDLLKPVNKTISLLAAVSRLAMTTIHGLNLINYFFVLLLLGGGGDYVGVFEPAQINSLVMLFLDAHAYGFSIGILFLTLHVFGLGYLIYKSGYFPKVLGILFTIAAVGYLLDSSALLLLKDYTETPVFFALPIAVSEIAFPIWLLVKGLNMEEWRKRTQETA